MKAKVKTKTIPKIKKELWDHFRKFIYERDGNTCVTCGRWCEGKGRHAGHFITGSTCPPSLYFDELNVNVQCYQCNVNKSGNWPAYYAVMVQRLGLRKVNAMLKHRNKVEKWERGKYEKMIEKYKALCT